MARFKHGDLVRIVGNHRTYVFMTYAHDIPYIDETVVTNQCLLYRSIKKYEKILARVANPPRGLLSWSASRGTKVCQPPYFFGIDIEKVCRIISPDQVCPVGRKVLIETYE